jgi:hypothetical protein
VQSEQNRYPRPAFRASLGSREEEARSDVDTPVGRRIQRGASLFFWALLAGAL